MHIQGAYAQQKTVFYRVEYSQPNGTCGGTDLVPLNLTVSDFTTARGVMERGVQEGGAYYQFSASFSDQDGVVDYVIDAINGTQGEPPCRWVFYVESSGGDEIAPTSGLSSYVPGNNFHVILRYETEVATPTIVTTYNIAYLDPLCAPVGLTAPESIRVTTSSGGSTALDVMEEAVARGGRQYQFSVNYVSVDGGSFGYVIDQVCTVLHADVCKYPCKQVQPFSAHLEHCMQNVKVQL